ncbi:MAG: sigma 54-interacting transcriptional regulator [Caloramator sp.]|nr:sigma 54-interacting transcriptional regulator [Caloramator sp.]
MGELEVKNFINIDTYYLKENEINENVIEKFLESRYDILPILNNNNFIVGYIEKKNVFECIKNKQYFSYISKDLSKISKVTPTTSVKNVLDKIYSAVLVDEKGKFIGMLDYNKLNCEFIKIIEEYDKQIDYSFVLNTILETVYDGILVVDAEGYIKFISKAYCKFLGVNEGEVIGKHVTDVIENTRMHIVAKTGIPEYAQIQKINGNYMVATRIPITKDGKIIGVVGKVLFRNLDELEDLHNKIRGFENELKEYKGELKNLNQSQYNFDDIIGSSPKIVDVKKFAMKASLTDSNVLIIAESGTGKELFAHAIHRNSKRGYSAFVKVNCAAIPPELLEAELFGYEEGAFTGAKKGGRIGKFEIADGGTIFLDEIGDMPLNMQAKLLRVIQEKEIERIGGTSPKRIDVRIIAATNKNLEELVQEGKFREDLFYRLNVITLNIPPLRERKKDITEIAYHYLNKLSNKYNKRVEKISKNALKKLVEYSWPGNIRELINVIERAVNIIEDERELDVYHLPTKISGINRLTYIRPLDEIIKDTEKNVIIEALRYTKGNKSEAAKLLNMSRSNFYEKLQKYNIYNDTDILG